MGLEGLKGMKGKTLILLDPSRPRDDFLPSIEKAIRPGTKVIFVTPLTTDGMKNSPETSGRLLTAERRWFRRLKAFVLRWQKLRRGTLSTESPDVSVS